MSSSSSPVQTQSPVEGFSSPPGRRTRTVAIIKNHALEYRLEIESRMSEAGFEIVKERQMEFEIESDPDTMFDLFGEDYICFAEGPVRIYVLERRRAVQVWKTIMGPADPEIAKQEAPNSIRALLGISHEQNAVMGSQDEETAEIQIMSIFASSPPLPSVELPDVGSDSYVSDPYVSESLHSKSSRGTPRAQSTSTENDKPKFQARPLPVTHDSPDIVPRMSRAAALRMGVVDPSVSPKRFPATPESIKKTFAGVPGHKRTETISVASTAPPVTPPRMTRAASLRLGIPVEPTALKPRGIAKAKSAGAAPSETFDGVPGHKRRESFQVASTKPPTVQPRTNRSAELRVSKEAAPPSSFNFRQASTISRASSRLSLDGSRPPTRPASAASVHNGPSRPISRTTSRSSIGGSSRPFNASSESNKPGGSTNDGDAAPKPKARLSVGAPPTIVPRTNKSAALRAAKMSLGSAGLPANGSSAKSPVVKKTTSVSARTVKA
ncbi:hypothetical protein PsYK624_145370 [Phanerochaete sordida]|uniref:Nucleoside diphosphate kinase n=1 Tax=Phanerochaete sordida TaxID=48140 RepID=A0A9P3GRT5_9APHY|nr:hypothetical protein PsYK624_145370 [Phanerochaete sordida]